MHKLPENLRDLLKQPMGDLVSEKELINKLRDEKIIISVGDMVTYTILKYGIEPIFCIVDFKTRRGRFPDEHIKVLESFGTNVIDVENPKGTITDGLWEAIRDAFESSNRKVKTRIQVRGEEDLASLAVISLAPSDAIIIYGLPDKGVLIIRPTRQNKDIVKDVLSKM